MSHIVFAPGCGVGAFAAVNRVDFAIFSGLTDSIDKLVASRATR